MSFHRFFKGPTPECGGIVQGMVCCPCCGYPTLDSPSDYEICVLCWWEDGPEQIVIGVHTVGGPNGSYSLAEAQANFADHGDMYRCDRTRIAVVSKPSRNRLALLNFVQAWDGKRPFDVERFGRLLAAARR